MAFVPNRRNRPVADAAIAETPVATGQTNDNPYAFDDADVEADYATAEEFRTYDDPDSVQDILRDKPEQFYVGTVEKTPSKIRARTAPLDLLTSEIGHTFSNVPVYFYGCQTLPLSGTVTSVEFYESPDISGSPIMSYRPASGNTAQGFLPGFPIYLDGLTVRIRGTFTAGSLTVFFRTES